MSRHVLKPRVPSKPLQISTQLECTGCLNRLFKLCSRLQDLDLYRFYRLGKIGDLQPLCFEHLVNVLFVVFAINQDKYLEWLVTTIPMVPCCTHWHILLGSLVYSTWSSLLDKTSVLFSSNLHNTFQHFES